MKQQIERVVLRLDAASETNTAIDTAVRLASRWKVPLHGVFIEDEELLNLAELPFARQTTVGGGPQPLSKAHIENHLRAVEERARQQLASSAARHHLRWSFEVVRCLLATEAARGRAHDFVVASAMTRPIGSHFRVVSRWWSLITIVEQPFLLARRQWDTGGSVIAFLRHRSAEAVRALDLAAQIARFGDHNLTVVGAPDVEHPDDFEAWVSSLEDEHALHPQTELAASGVHSLERRLVELDCRLLVLEAGAAGARPQIRELAEHLSCDVLVIGRGHEGRNPV
jgi:nucleotide-binding universal stress UspA family protein